MSAAQHDDRWLMTLIFAVVAGVGMAIAGLIAGGVDWGNVASASWWIAVGYAIGSN